MNIAWSEITCFSNKTKGCKKPTSSRKNSLNFCWTHLDLFFSVVPVAKRYQHRPKQRLLLGVVHWTSGQVKFPEISLALETGSGQLAGSIFLWFFYKSPPRVSCDREIFREYGPSLGIINIRLVPKQAKIKQLQFLVPVFSKLSLEIWLFQTGRFGTHPNVDDKPQIHPYYVTSGCERLALWQCIGWCKNIHAVQSWKNLLHMTCHLPHPMLASNAGQPLWHTAIYAASLYSCHQLSTSQLRFSVPLVDMLPVVPSDHFFPDLDISCSEPLTYKILLLPAFLPKRLHRLNPNKLHGCQFRTSIHWARNKQTHL